MKKKWQYVLSNKQVYYLFLLFIGVLFLSCLEIIGLASITNFVSILVNNDSNNFLLSYLKIDQILNLFEIEKKVFYGAIFLFFLYLFKTLIQIFYNFFEVYLTRDITLNNSVVTPLIPLL